jgi:hypothetical protein
MATEIPESDCCGRMTVNPEITIQSSIRLIAPAAWEMH